MLMRRLADLEVRSATRVVLLLQKARAEEGSPNEGQAVLACARELGLATIDLFPVFEAIVLGAIGVTQQLSGAPMGASTGGGRREALRERDGGPLAVPSRDRSLADVASPSDAREDVLRRRFMRQRSRDLGRARPGLFAQDLLVDAIGGQVDVGEFGGASDGAVE